MTTPNKLKINGDDDILIDLRNDATGLVGNYGRLKKKKKSSNKISRI